MNTDHTLEKAGQQFSVTRERIRQMIARKLLRGSGRARSRRRCAS
jgi:DNA-directed RNA polymerase sigma subunit (sigma70/sigma32)